MDNVSSVVSQLACRSFLYVYSYTHTHTHTHTGFSGHEPNSAWRSPYAHLAQGKVESARECAHAGACARACATYHIAYKSGRGDTDMLRDTGVSGTMPRRFGEKKGGGDCLSPALCWTVENLWKHSNTKRLRDHPRIGVDRYHHPDSLCTSFEYDDFNLHKKERVKKQDKARAQGISRISGSTARWSLTRRAEFLFENG